MFTELSNVSSVEELKKLYHKLALQYHPDKGGSLEAMQELNDAYEIAYASLSDKPDSWGIGEAFVDIIERVITLDGIMVEIVGAWVWVTGNTYPVKDLLKVAGFKWASKKRAWFWYPPEARSTNRTEITLDEIRGKYGTQVISDRRAVAIGG